MTTTTHRQAETRFVALMTELFQMDEAQALDFGIYRVIRRHNQEVRAFLGEIVTDHEDARLEGGRLSALLDTAFTASDRETEAGDRHRLQAIANQLGLKPGMTAPQREALLGQAEAMPAVKTLVDEYHALREALASHQTADEDRAEVLNRLYQFFSRHYQDGDFIVARRYGRGGARYVRSTGEDTEFHWATEDMYYIKSGDIFTDFPLRLSNGQRLCFTLEPDSLQATRAALKPNDKAHYELQAARRAREVIEVRLRYLKGAQTERHKEEILAALQRAGVPARLEAEARRWLQRFIARNQSDFFIHKRLRAALSADLDIFIKTEVLDLDQVLAGALNETDLTRRALRVARLVREIGTPIIDFLATLEDFQKALWEKKKLVLHTRYVITLDRLERLAPDWLAAHINGIVARQRREWRDLGLGERATASDCLRGKASGQAQTQLTLDGQSPDGTSAGIYLPLPVDTANFETEFKWSMLDAVTAKTPLDEALDGLAIQSDNWQALNAIEDKYRDQVKCIYIDPPYNTNASGIPYKNGYRDSSWVTLMENRVEKLYHLMSGDGALFVSIDKVERTPLEQLLDRIFTSSNRIEELIWVQNTNDGRSPTYSTNHEYVEVYAKQRQPVEQDRNMFREPKPGYAEVINLIDSLNPDYPTVAEIEMALKQLYDQHKADYRNEVEAQGLDWEIEKRNDPWKGLFPYSNAEYRDRGGKYVPEREAKLKQASIWVWRESDWTIMSSETKQSDSVRDPNHFNYRYYRPLHPRTGKPCALSTRGWKGTQFFDPDHPERNSFESLVADHRIAFGEDESKVPQQKRMLHEVETNVAKSVFTDYSDGEKQTTAMFGKAGLFLAPKHTNFVSRFITQATKPDSFVVDCFGGSGSTAHSVIELNRIERSNRKFITVEVNRYFDTLIIPRLIKAGCSSRWSNGQALELNGAGLFMRVQVLEQYEDTLENLDIDPQPGGTQELPFDNPALALRYRLRQSSRELYCGIERFSSPFGLEMRRASGGEVALATEVDLIETLPYLLGMEVSRLYRDPQGVVLLGHDHRGRSLAIFFRDGLNPETRAWLIAKLAAHPADRIFTNDPASLNFEGSERLEAIEAVFALQFGRD